MEAEATIKDVYGDEAWVASGGGRVYLDVVIDPGRVGETGSDLSLTPEAARKLAKALKRAAKAAEAA